MAQQHGVQHVTSNYLGAFIGGGTQFRCDGAGGGAGGGGGGAGGASGASGGNHRQLKRLDERYERQRRCSTVPRPKQSNWQYCCPTARQYGPNSINSPGTGVGPGPSPEGEPVCTIAVATSKQAEVIAFDTGELDCVVQRIATVGTRGKVFVVHDLLRPISLRGKGNGSPQFSTRAKCSRGCRSRSHARSWRSARRNCEYKTQKL